MIKKGSVRYGVFGGMMFDTCFETLEEAQAYARAKERKLRNAKLHIDMKVRVIKMTVLEETLVPKSDEPYGEVRLQGLDELILGR